MVQKNALDVDLNATFDAHAALGERWDELVAAEARAIEKLAPCVVVGDIPALGFAAAARAGVPAAALGNFSWDWIFARYAKSDARFAPIAERYARAYASARLLLRLPMHCPMPAFGKIEDLPLVARLSRVSRRAARARLGIDARKSVVLVSFGGFGAGAVDARAGDDLSRFLFIGFTAKPKGLRGDWLRLPRHLTTPHVDLVRACDVVLSKPGYGTISEAVAHGTRLLLAPRAGFPEIPALERYVASLRAGTAISRAELFSGRWGKALERALSLPPPEPPPSDGAARAARRLTSFAQVC